MSPVRLDWEVTDAGRAALAAVHRTETLPIGKRLDIEVMPAGLVYLDQHRPERVSPALRGILSNPARRSAS